ncbi:hypothetical protein BVRB_9g213050 [Beta vulgaris subsp. vulgaris]|nr:hypothetical protein BVRB_9g213050 [Beta vulgaris subsp. vulgaris]
MTLTSHWSWPGDLLPAGGCYFSPLSCHLDKLLCADHVVVFKREMRVFLRM